jgi:cytochrome c556
MAVDSGLQATGFRFLAVLLSGVAVVSTVVAVQQDSPRRRPLVPAQDEIAAPPDKRAMEHLMQQKLAAAEAALEGVAKDDHAMLQESAARMIELSRLEIWERMASPRFVQDTADFVRAAEFLNRMAESKDTEGAELGFLRLTMACSNCHRHVRTAAVAGGAEGNRQRKLAGASASPFPVN